MEDRALFLKLEYLCREIVSEAVHMQTDEGTLFVCTKFNELVEALAEIEEARDCDMTAALLSMYRGLLNDEG